MESNVKMGIFTAFETKPNTFNLHAELDFYPMANALSNHCTVAWVTRPERSKGAKDEVKQARRAQSRPEGPPARSWALKGHLNF